MIDAMNRPRISILIPSRDRLELLLLALSSIRRQNFSSVEVVISDNNSLIPYEIDFESFCNFTVIYSRSDETLSVTENWNRALNISSGDYVVMLGDDDALAPGYLERIENLIQYFDCPDVLYLMAFNYAYPGAIPARPAGYFCAVNNSRLFDERQAAYELPHSESKKFTEEGLSFHHTVSFNAQHFVWSRRFIERLGREFFRSPYPDYFACFMTFALANRIIVVPEPCVIIGISKQSFGHFFATGQQNEGFKKFESKAINFDQLFDEDTEIRTSIAYPGSGHYRNWLLAAAYTRSALIREFGIDLPLNCVRYQTIQRFQLAQEHARLPRQHRENANYLKELSRSDAADVLRLSRLFRQLDSTGALENSNSAQAIEKYLRIHSKPTIVEYDIGRHQNIDDAFSWLEETISKLGKSVPLLYLRTLDAKDLHIEGLSRELEAKDSHIEGLDRELEAKDSHILKLDRIVFDLNQQNHDQADEIGDLLVAVNRSNELLSIARDEIVAFECSAKAVDRRIKLRKARNWLAQIVRTAARESREINKLAWRTARIYLRLRKPAHLALSRQLTDTSLSQPDGASLEPVSRVAEQGAPVASALDHGIRLFSEIGNMDASVLLSFERSGKQSFLSYFLPLRGVNARVDAALLTRPTVRILLPSLRKQHATGGPNTAFLIGCYLAHAGVRVSFLSTDVPLDDDLAEIKLHLYRLSGFHPDDFSIAFEDGSNRLLPIKIGINDLHLATAWWTAHPASWMASLTRQKRIIYLIQDYETLLHESSESYAGAEQSYDLDHLPIFNTALLKDHLRLQKTGRFASAEFGNNALSFEPAVDARFFFPGERPTSSVRRLLFYTRPKIAKRNLFGLGVAALLAAVDAGCFGDAGWEFIGMGEPFEPVDLGRGYILKPAPWLDFPEYASLMRSADILLSLMLSPHPSYPPLEMAACGGLTVTTVFGSKTRKRLAELSPLIIGVPPTVGDIVLGLTRAINACDELKATGSHQKLSNSPTTWEESLRHVVPFICRELGLESKRDQDLEDPYYYGLGAPEPADENVVTHRAAIELRQRSYSIVTTVFDTNPLFIRELAESIFSQDLPDPFEWLILDNGSSAVETREALDAVATNRLVRLERVPANLGIVGGMRWCLKNAVGAYILPIDSDDIINSSALSTIDSFLVQTGFPVVLYTNEDKLSDGFKTSAYIKPAWDPVLFVHSCYIAHLTVIHRRTALELGCYEDPAVEGCHDWDTFMRFMAAGYVPAHLPELLYSWRMHSASTSSNFRSKPYIFASHKVVLGRFLAARDRMHRYEVSEAPLFPGFPDYRFSLRKGFGKCLDVHTSGYPSLILPSAISRRDLCERLKNLDVGAKLVRILDESVGDIGLLGYEEVSVLTDLFPDTVMIGGRIHDGVHVLEAAYVFGFDGSVGCPDVGRSVQDPGYFAQMWKPRSVAAVSARLVWIDKDFLDASLDSLPEHFSLTMLGCWLGAIARDRALRTIYSPYVEGLVTSGISALSQEDASLFNLHFAHLSSDLVGYSRNLGLTPQTAYRLSDERADLVRFDYPDAVGRSRAVSGRPFSTISSVSILTTVYERTDVALFREAVRSVREQTRDPLEWIVLAHGPISEELAELLRDLESCQTLALFSSVINLGITGGLRFCLERAEGDFVICLDADDMLVPFAVEEVLDWISRHPAVEVFYSDEDLIIDDAYSSPFYRPDFDPALFLSHSYIWHLIVFRRPTALLLDVFSDKDVEYAQDWDLLLRFYFSGCAPLHIPKVLYHWRQHSRSISNSGSNFTGSFDSVRSLLNRVRENLKNPTNFEVDLYPVALGSRDLYLKRLQRDAPKIVDVSFSFGDNFSDPVDVDFQFDRSLTFKIRRLTDELSRLTEFVEGFETELVFFRGPGLLHIEAAGIWQGLRHFELIESCSAVTGAIATRAGIIVAAAPVPINESELFDPLIGRSMRDAHRFSIGLKPHRVAAASADLCVVRREFLLNALRARPPMLCLRSLGAWLGEFARSESRLIIYEPLFRGFVPFASSLAFDDCDGLSRYYSTFSAARQHANVPLLGLAPSVRMEMRHKL